MTLAILLLTAAEAAIPAAYGVVTHRFTESVVHGQAPRLTVTAAEAEVVVVLECTHDDQKLEWETGVVPKGESRVFELAFADAEARSAQCGLFARMANGLAEKKAIDVAWTVEPPKPDAPPAQPKGESESDTEGESVVTPKGAEPTK